MKTLDSISNNWWRVKFCHFNSNIFRIQIDSYLVYSNFLNYFQTDLFLKEWLYDRELKKKTFFEKFNNHGWVCHLLLLIDTAVHIYFKKYLGKLVTVLILWSIWAIKKKDLFSFVFSHLSYSLIYLINFAIYFKSRRKIKRVAITTKYLFFVYWLMKIKN